METPTPMNEIPPVSIITEENKGIKNEGREEFKKLSTYMLIVGGALFIGAFFSSAAKFIGFILFSGIFILVGIFRVLFADSLSPSNKVPENVGAKNVHFGIIQIVVSLLVLFAVFLVLYISFP